MNFSLNEDANAFRPGHVSESDIRAQQSKSLNDNVAVDELFDPDWYLSKNADVAAAVRKVARDAAYRHYVQHGRKEGRKGSAANEMQDYIQADLKSKFLLHNGENFLAPTDLRIVQSRPKCVALVGSCFLEQWALHTQATDVEFEQFIVNNAAVLPEQPVHSRTGKEFDLQIVQIPLRSIMQDNMFWHSSYNNISHFEGAFNICCERLEFQLRSRLTWNSDKGLLSFVANFPLPQRNPNGCLFSRYDIRNPEHFVYMLNIRLENLVQNYHNAFILDVDRICASFGRRYVQDDLVTAFSHNAVIGTPGYIGNRIEPMLPMAEHFQVTWPQFFRSALWVEVETMYRVVRQVDSVKIVMTDLDDTIWNGVSGDIENPSAEMTEGWPLGYIEALAYLKQRGVLLAIVSKNEESRIREIWDDIFRGRLRFDDFAIVRINWKPKVENIREILSLVNLLPKSAVFIDDNPVERDAVKQQLPDIRVLGRFPYYLRQTLLWASETQTVSLTDESSRRTEMVRAQVRREENKEGLSRDEFLVAAAPHVRLAWLESKLDARSSRAFELLNKTNQFNTTGRRWTHEEFGSFLSGGGMIAVFDVRDAYTDYGLIGVVMLQGGIIEQWVMSCRVLGYDVEVAVMSEVVRVASSADIVVKGILVETPVNFPCRDLFKKCGFELVGGEWVLGLGVEVKVPKHVEIEKWGDV
jgi:FkbH-like protein